MGSKDNYIFFFFSQDAACLSVTIMKKKLHGRIFLGCDNHPVSRLVLFPINRHPVHNADLYHQFE